MKYTAHIISHSHMDREWYMPFEQHNMRLVKIIDDVLFAVKNDVNFKSFHLDGQTIVIEDYLKVRPEKKKELHEAIINNKIYVGPWYVLQDAFLTSSEANVRNMQIGQKISRRFGCDKYCGYYPDTFGIYGQVAQLMKLSEIDNVYFGRGVSSTGFNNEVSNEFESKFSEMILKSPNNDEVDGILFANWYSNGIEIPTDAIEAKKYWDQKLSDAKRYCKSSHLLFMNGCDHQPYQKDVTLAIDVANELYEDVEFMHSNLLDYIECINNDIDKTELNVIQGELRSQYTDGYGTLVNTASARVYQKQMNAKCQDNYEKLAEPLSALLLNSNDYHFDELEYGWKKLMENHPHDSICGCSVDSVHRSMDARFEDSYEVSKYIIKDSIEKYTSEKDNVEKAFTIINPLSTKKVHQKCKIELVKYYFSESSQIESYNKANEFELGDIKIKDDTALIDKYNVTDLGVVFSYDLPNDKFRQPYYTRVIEVEFIDVVDPFSTKSYSLVKSEKNSLPKKIDYLENEFYKIEFDKYDGIILFDKKNNRKLVDVISIYDHADAGNEYMFGKVENDNNISFTSSINDCKVVDNNVIQKMVLSGCVSLPASLEKTFYEEKVKMVPYNERKSNRTKELIECPFEINIEIDETNIISLNIQITNNVMDHRIRASFKTHLNYNQIEVDSIFENVIRNVSPTSVWENPSNDQHQGKFVCVEESGNSFIIGNNGLYEYECNENSIDITLLRSVSEMGDWGHFETPSAQCIGKNNYELTFAIAEVSDKYTTINILRDYYTKIPVINNLYIENQKLVDLNYDSSFCITSVKRNDSGELIIRGFGNQDGIISAEDNVTITNLLEEKNIKTLKEYKYKKNEIVTFKINK